VSDLDAVEHWVSLYSEKSQDEPFSGVVMCHAKHGEKSGTQWKPDEWESYFRTNCTSVVSLIHHLDGWGCLTDECKIVIFGSFLQNGSANQPAYAASKAALWAWMRSYTMAQSAQDSRSVNMIWPARVNTPSNPARDLPDTDPNFFREPENLAEETLRLLDDDLGRRGTTIDVGRN
jgi:NAD(P)-dependent dehydrogenase (short-subunit alcohol dehydrogenase family)